MKRFVGLVSGLAVLAAVGCGAGITATFIAREYDCFVTGVDVFDQMVARSREQAERVGVADRMQAFPARMSGGERQRVAAARALINGAKLLLCDEPTGNLDRETGSTLVGLLLELAEQQSVTVLMVTHNVQQAARFGRCLLLRDGCVAPYTPSEAPGVGL